MDSEWIWISDGSGGTLLQYNSYALQCKMFQNLQKFLLKHFQHTHTPSETGYCLPALPGHFDATRKLRYKNVFVVVIIFTCSKFHFWPSLDYKCHFQRKKALNWSVFYQSMKFISWQPSLTHTCMKLHSQITPQQKQNTQTECGTEYENSTFQYQLVYILGNTGLNMQLSSRFCQTISAHLAICSAMFGRMIYYEAFYV
jgi:hypothetical protein